MTYWTVFGFLNLIEFFTDIVLYWIPFYYIIKAAIILWLSLPQFKGAQLVYTQFLRPFLLANTAKVDSTYEKLRQQAEEILKRD